MKVNGSRLRVACASWLWPMAGILLTASAPSSANDSGNVTLEWALPTENVDGSPLNDLAGFTLRYGISPDALTNIIRVTNPTVTSFVVDNLPPGRWFFASTSFTASGVESFTSTIVSATIP